MADDLAMNRYTKLALCIAVLLICLIVIGGVNFVTYEEYFFSHPPKRDIERHLPVRSMPAFSSIYFRYYRYSWIAAAVVLLWSGLLMTRRKTTIEGVAVFAAFSLLGTVAIATLAAIAIYLGNQTFVFNGQHLR